jgi:hypothetical protein
MRYIAQEVYNHLPHPATRPSTRGQAPREGCPHAQEVPAEFKRDVAVDVEVSEESVRGWGRKGDIDDVIKDDPTAAANPEREVSRCVQW